MSERTNAVKMNRRTFVQVAGGATVAAAGAPLLSSCADDQASGPESFKPVKLPTYAANDVIEADLPAMDKGVLATCFQYPESPKKVHPSPPAKGGSISMLKIATSGVPPAVGSNPFWQELNKRVGTDLKLNNVIQSDYSAKLSTTLAGGDLPDLVQLQLSGTPHLADVLTHEFQDLSPWLSGDAAKDYPNLAALPTSAWANVAFAGGLWGVPWPLGVPGDDNKVRQDILDAMGLNADLSDGQDFLDLCREVSDPKGGRWAIDRITTALGMVGEMIGAPNGWKEENGTFTSAMVTEEYKDVLQTVRKMWKSEYIYPESLSSTANFHQWFANGTTVILRDGYTNWGPLTDLGLSVGDDFQISGIVTPRWEGGGQAAHYEGTGIYTFTAMKKADEARVKELLAVLNWFATPFGSEEHLFVNFGLEGRDYTLNGSDPVATDTGIQECQQMNLSYIATGPRWIYIPGHAEVAETDHRYLEKLMQESLPLPTVGLYSETALTKGVTITEKINDLRQEIVVGRQPLSAWDDAVQAWRSGGGDQMKTEYEEALSQAGGK